MKQNELKTKSREAYELIKEMILNGTALPGTRLILFDLEEKLGVGREPIRDALLLLDKSGLVQNIPYKGAIVTLPPSLKEMEIIFEHRKQLEVTLVLEAIKKITKKDIEKLAKLVTDMEQHYKNEEKFFHIDRDFHKQLYKTSQMPHLLSIFEHLMDFIHTYLSQHIYTEELIQTFNKQHKKIILGIMNKDTNLLIASLEENINYGLQMVQEEMKLSNNKEKTYLEPY